MLAFLLANLIKLAVVAVALFLIWNQVGDLASSQIDQALKDAFLVTPQN